MSRYIDADLLQEALARTILFRNGRMVLVYLIDRQPTADVRENVKGEWIEDGALTKCSVCGNTSEFCGTENFCYNCGADMRGGNDD